MLENLVEPVTRGDPESPLRWASKSLRRLESELRSQAYVVSLTPIGDLLKKLSYNNRKTLEDGDHPDHNEQFEFINNRAKEAMCNGLPVISVDTKKKGWLGSIKTAG